MAFQEVRDALVYGFADGYLDEEEFLILYELYKSVNPLYPYWEFQPFCLQNIDSSECLAEFRVTKEDIPFLAVCEFMTDMLTRDGLWWFGRSLLTIEETYVSLSLC